MVVANQSSTVHSSAWTSRKTEATVSIHSPEIKSEKTKAVGRVISNQFFLDAV
ncbi:hypothetical protein HMI54_008133 [Coelomomyces lativittatus]|nr:hypothetical protein HMI54_008133 [Coelomomyces lativittatus]